MRAFMKNLFLFLMGGILYCLIELAFRGRTHPAMLVVGGLCFILCGQLNEVIPWEMPIQWQMLLCGLMITGVELVAGMILNIWLGMNIWDYSNLPLNFMGQICIPFSIGWCFLSAVGIILDDHLRYLLFGEEKPHYIFRRRKC